MSPTLIVTVELSVSTDSHRLLTSSSTAATTHVRGAAAAVDDGTAWAPTTTVAARSSATSTAWSQDGWRVADRVALDMGPLGERLVERDSFVRTSDKPSGCGVRHVKGALPVLDTGPRVTGVRGTGLWLEFPA